MLVDIYVALSNYLEVETAVTSQLRKHVIKKRHASFNVNLSSAVEVEFNKD
jgi:hypothetical protein